jgi:hypothetical protein
VLAYLEFAANQNGYGDILQLGDGSSAQNTLASVPHNLVLDHLYVHGDPSLGQKRCIALNAAQVTTSIRTSPSARRSARTLRRSAAGTVPARTPSRTIIWKRPARISCSGARIRRSRTWCLTT